MGELERSVGVAAGSVDRNSCDAPRDANQGKPPRLSLVVIWADSDAWNRFASLLIAYSAVPQIEVIVVQEEDEGVGQFVWNDAPAVRLFGAPIGLGESDRRSLGARLATGDLVAVIDRPDSATERWIEHLCLNFGVKLSNAVPLAMPLRATLGAR